MVMTARELADLMPDATQLESNEPEMESSLHYAQLALLVTCLNWLWRDQDDFFVGANLTIYFSRQQLKNRDFRGPDFFLVKNTQKHPRKSWVVWEEEGQYPDLIIELLSDSTASVDKTLKKTLYQDRFRTPEYFWFSPSTLEFQGYRLKNQVYEAIAPNEDGHLWSEVLDLYLGVENGQLRYFFKTDELVPTMEESTAQAISALTQAQTEAAQAQTEAAQAQTEAAQEKERTAQLEAQLKALGIEPDV